METTKTDTAPKKGRTIRKLIGVALIVGAEFAAKKIAKKIMTKQ